MFRIPDEIMEASGEQPIAIEEKIEEVQDDLIRLEQFFKKYKVMSYTGWERIPEMTTYRKLKKELSELMGLNDK